jgi:hypothetical protein
MSAPHTRSAFDDDDDDHEHDAAPGPSPRASQFSDDDDERSPHHDDHGDVDADTASARSVSLDSPAHAVFAIPLDEPPHAASHLAPAGAEDGFEDDGAEDIPLSPASHVPLAAQAALALHLDEPEHYEPSMHSSASGSPLAVQTTFIVPDEDDTTHAAPLAHDTSPPVTAVPKRTSAPLTLSDVTSESDARSLYTDEVDMRDSPMSSLAPSLAPSVAQPKLDASATETVRALASPPLPAATYPPRPPVASRDSRASIMSTASTSSNSKKARPESLLAGPQGPLVLGLALVDFNHIVSRPLAVCQAAP